MEKKIERVPYISKWYKEEPDWSQLFKFDFKDELMTEETAKRLNDCFKETMDCLNNVGSDYDIDKYYQTATCTTGYSKPNVILMYEHNLTHKDIEYLRELIHLIHGDIDAVVAGTKSRDKEAHERLYCLYDYLINRNGVRDKAQEKQLKELEEQYAKPKKSYEGTLGEHWKELMDLFEIKSKHGLKSFKNIDENCLIIFSNDCDSTNKLYSVFNKLGIDFIKDFIKACEKCED
jgi:hypothetical protein